MTISLSNQNSYHIPFLGGSGDERPRLFGMTVVRNVSMRLSILKIGPANTKLISKCANENGTKRRKRMRLTIERLPGRQLCYKPIQHCRQSYKFLFFFTRRCLASRLPR